MPIALLSPGSKNPAMAAAQALIVAAVYYGAARLGLLRQVVADGAVVTPLWPPTGIALSCLLYLGLRIWPGIAIGALLAIFTIHDSFAPAGLVIAAGNTLAPVCAWLLLRKVGFRPELDRLRDGTALIFLGALGAMLISASTGAGVLALSGKLPRGDFWPIWSAWWAGDAMGVLVFTPLLLVMHKLRLPRATDRWPEATALLVIAIPVMLLATRSSLSLLFVVFPVILWAALRFELAGSAPCACLASLLAVVAGTDGVGPFQGQTLFEVTVNLAAFNGSVALTALLMAAIVTEQRNVRRRVERACEDLATLVEQLASGGPGDRGR
ncbi:MASE1 domain-containing protein [Streptomyces sp. H10-C2]|uniref:MASE1 domain-containing protein n=1 Tax=unclassified Streptomyces TaxID=2593676 RepID=UPI0024BAE7C2|nr:MULTISPECIES: MASE1 domain-containing protein [unclassified Streptomyces]MDJ0347265.1 MASE1 domain-containing protein [Streptomyces sp. PH10-H1]MDJ0375493.1 MASE1 domain-containing protein [Streptomyces sp. H10-C2]